MTFSFTTRGVSFVTNRSRRWALSCRSARGCNHDANDGDCRTRDAEVLPLPGADDGVDDASASPTAYPWQRLRRQDSWRANGGRRLRPRLAVTKDSRGLR